MRNNSPMCFGEFVCSWKQIIKKRTRQSTLDWVNVKRRAMKWCIADVVCGGVGWNRVVVEWSKCWVFASDVAVVGGGREEWKSAGKLLGFGIAVKSVIAAGVVYVCVCCRMCDIAVVVECGHHRCNRGKALCVSPVWVDSHTLLSQKNERENHNAC